MDAGDMQRGVPGSFSVFMTPQNSCRSMSFQPQLQDRKTLSFDLTSIQLQNQVYDSFRNL